MIHATNENEDERVRRMHVGFDQNEIIGYARGDDKVWVATKSNKVFGFEIQDKATLAEGTAETTIEFDFEISFLDFHENTLEVVGVMDRQIILSDADKNEKVLLEKKGNYEYKGVGSTRGEKRIYPFVNSDNGHIYILNREGIQVTTDEELKEDAEVFMDTVIERINKAKSSIERIETGCTYGVDDSNHWEGIDFHNIVLANGKTMFDACNSIYEEDHIMVPHARAREKLFLVTLKQPFLNKANLGNFLFITAQDCIHIFDYNQNVNYWKYHNLVFFPSDAHLDSSKDA